MSKKQHKTEPIIAFDHAPRCGGTWLTFEYFAFIFGWERMLVWGSDFPLGECGEKPSLNFANEILENNNQLRWFGGHLNPEWPLLKKIKGRKVEWVTQIRHPAAQLRSARAFTGTTRPVLIRKRLAATLRRVAKGEYSEVGILGSDFDRESLSAKLVQKFAWPSIQAPKRNASNFSILPRERPSLDGHSMAEFEYDEFWFAGKEMLEWWELAIQSIRQREPSLQDIAHQPAGSDPPSVNSSSENGRDTISIKVGSASRPIEVVDIRRTRHFSDSKLATIQANKMAFSLRKTRLLLQVRIHGANLDSARIGTISERTLFEKFSLVGRRFRKMWLQFSKPYVRWDLVDGQTGTPFRHSPNRGELIVASNAPTPGRPLRLWLQYSTASVPQIEPPEISKVWHF